VVAQLHHPQGDRRYGIVVVTKKPDLVFVLIVAFAAGVVLTALLPFASNETVAAPASELQAGVIVND
jgi:hypothetical protein